MLIDIQKIMTGVLYLVYIPNLSISKVGKWFQVETAHILQQQEKDLQKERKINEELRNKNKVLEQISHHSDSKSDRDNTADLSLQHDTLDESWPQHFLYKISPKIVSFLSERSELSMFASLVIL